MRFIQSGNEARVYRTSSNNKLARWHVWWLAVSGYSWTSFDDDAEIFLLSFLIYAEIANTDIFMTTQHCTQNTAKPKVAVDH